MILEKAEESEENISHILATKEDIPVQSSTASLSCLKDKDFRRNLMPEPLPLFDGIV